MGHTSARASEEDIRLSEMHDRALALCNQGEHAEAASLLLAVLEEDPGNLVVRRSFVKSITTLKTESWPLKPIGTS
jgi:hypothetical protein